MIWPFAYNSPGAIKALLEQNNLALSKKFGQNFLINEAIVKKIADALSDIKNKEVWEIGAGIGVLTKELLLKEAHVTSFEIDYGFCRILKEEAFKDVANFNLIEGDVLKTIALQTKKPNAIIGNLPYNVGSLIIADLMEKQILTPVMVFTLQKEVAQRLSSEAGSKLWSAFTILVQIDYEVLTLFTIKNSSFFPPPNVESATIRLIKRENSLVPLHLRDTFLKIVKTLFASRRKTVKNNFMLKKEGFIDETFILKILKEADIEPNVRSETLEIDKFLHLSEAYYSNLSKHRPNYPSYNGKN
jgi:16S rRNA (adenine1518-N6/adenine1519-N6)-dimethyltransferase